MLNAGKHPQEGWGVVLFKLMVLALGLAGWVTYLLIWLGVRIFGSVTLRFGLWGPGWLEWFELWIEPLVLIGCLLIIGWVAWRELVDAAQRNASASPKMPSIGPQRRLKWRARRPQKREKEFESASD